MEKFFEFDNSFRFEKNDYSFLGKISGNLRLFLEADFDLLINYFNSNSYEINLFSLKCKKKISAGFINTDSRVNDIIFNFSPNKKKLFIEEISKYVKIENNYNFLMGTGVALVTPFNSNGSVDYNSLEKIINSTIHGGVDYLVILGTTSESPTLSEKEKEKIISYVVKKNNERVPLVIGIGGNNTNNLIDRIKKINDSSFSAILSVSPYYNRPSQFGIFKHYEKIVSISNLPIILYNVPSRTGSNIEINTVTDLNKILKKL